MQSHSPNRQVAQRLSQTLAQVPQAFREFLGLPAAIILGFLLLAWLTTWLDQIASSASLAVRAFLGRHIFSSARATSDLLDAIAGGVISVTSITITLLLLVVQQSASTLGAEVFDQFLRRRQNQVYFGYFIGLALYALVILATVNEPFNPVLGGAVTLLGTLVGLFLLLVLFYTTIDQMRPAAIIDAIHDRTLAARQRQLALVARTQRAAHGHSPAQAPVTLEADGFVTGIHLEGLAEAIRDAPEAQIILEVTIGQYVAYRDRVAVVRAATAEAAEPLVHAAAKAIVLARRRDLDSDPAYGLQQLEDIAWTSMSSAKQNPAPGHLAILSLRDLLARWSDSSDTTEDPPARLPVVYPDVTIYRLFDALESLVVVAAESRQHQNLSAVVHTLATLFARLPAEYQPRAEALIHRLTATLPHHLLTAELEQSLVDLAAHLRAAERPTIADQVTQTLGEVSHNARPGVARESNVRH